MSEELFLEIGIGTRCRRNFETLSNEMDKIYKDEGVDMSVREFPVVYCLHYKGPVSIAEIQKLTGLSHSAISQTVKKLVTRDVLSLRQGLDARSKIIEFTKKGAALVKKLKPVWQTSTSAMIGVLEESETNILDAFADFEGALTRKPFTQRYNESKKTKHVGRVELIPYDIKYREEWSFINQQWIEKYFVMEQEDIINLQNPEENVLLKGGEIYFGLLDGKPVGVIALKHDKGTRFELSKMGVLPEAQGHGIAKLMIKKVIERYKARGGTELFLETNSILTPAITLYKKMGFKEVPYFETPYTRADYFMVLKES